MSSLTSIVFNQAARRANQTTLPNNSATLKATSIAQINQDIQQQLALRYRKIIGMNPFAAGTVVAIEQLLTDLKANSKKVDYKFYTNAMRMLENHQQFAHIEQPNPSKGGIFAKTVPSVEQTKQEENTATAKNDFKL